MTIRVLRSAHAGWECFVDVYLDGAVEFDYPEGDSGRLEDVQPYGRIAPGLGVITLAFAPRVLDPDHAPAQLYLLRAGQPSTVLAESTPNPEQTYAFNVPGSLLRHAAGATRDAARSVAHGVADTPSRIFPAAEMMQPWQRPEVRVRILDS